MSTRPPEKSMSPAEFKVGLVNQLSEIAQYLEILGENEFKVRAFRKGAETLESLEEAETQLSEIASGDVKVAGIGEGIKKAIAEYVETGRIAQHGDLAGRIPAGVLELMKVRGLGPKKAWALHQELGINSVGELEYACRENRLLDLKGFGKSIQEKLLQSIEDMKLHAGKVRIDEAWQLARGLMQVLRTGVGESTEIIPVGGLGRQSEVVDRLEFCFSGTVQNVGDSIVALPWDESGLQERREELFGAELAGYSGKLTSGPSVTLWVSENKLPPEAIKWLCAPDDGVCRDMIERDPRRFDSWELTWFEREWLESQRKPHAEAYRVSHDGNVKGVFHCHTDESDGRSTLEQMIKGAQDAGYEYIGISDHSQSASYAGGLSAEKIRDQKKKIDQLQKKYSIKIFHGIESDILADGALDYPKEVLENFDFIVASVHTRFQMDEAQMTERVVKALENPFTTIWGHPSGRLLLARRPYSLRWDVCLKAAQKHGVVVEIDAHPQRLDLDWRLGAEVEKLGLKVSIDPDAHDVAGLADTSYGQITAEKAMIPRGQILNLMSVDEVEKFLWERKKRQKK